MDARQERGLAIAKQAKIVKTPVGWKVPSQTGVGSYVVQLGGDKPFCTCPDFEKRNDRCKHIFAVEFLTKREDHPDGTTTITKAVRVTYKQNWPVYNAAQTHEQEHFVRLLQELCATVPQPPAGIKGGRPRLPMSDVCFGVTLKAYDQASGRRVMTDFREAQADGFMEKAPSFTSTFRYLENAELTPTLKGLIEASAAPLASVECDFAADSSGFATNTYSRWYDHKYGKERKRQTWVKTHIMCGVKTHIVTAVEATPFESSDARQLPGLLNTTAQTFQIDEVSADKGYSGRANLHVIDNIGARGYVPFMSSVTGKATPRHKFDGLWNRAFHYYNFNREEFLAHYHKRSNVETVFSMVKAKFGGSVRSKTPTAQVNEVLCKVLAHNVCCLIQSWYELGIAATFGAAVEQAVVPEPTQMFQNLAS